MPLVVEECRTALWRCSGNIAEAAQLLKISSMRLRNFVKNSPRLSAEVNEARQQLVDVAERNVADALTDEEDKSRRDSMTKFVLERQGKDRGWGTGAGKGGNTIINHGRMQISWGDGSSFDDDSSGTVEGTDYIDVTPNEAAE